MALRGFEQRRWAQRSMLLRARLPLTHAGREGGRSKCALRTRTALLPSVLRLHCAEAKQATPHRAVVFFKQAVVSRLGSRWMEGQLHEEVRGGFNGSLPPKKHYFYPSHFASYLLKTSSKWDDNTWVSARCIAFHPEICSCLLLYLQYYDTNNKDFIKLTKINIQKAGHKKRPLQPIVRWENWTNQRVLVSSTCVLLTIVIVALQASQFLLDSHRN